MFSTTTQVVFSEDLSHRWTIMELVAADRPGLLSEIGKVFWDKGIDLHGAKVMTVGERAEDVFYLTDDQGRPLDASRQERLAETLTEALDRRVAAA
jgi:[protein-PII] uridylyltransferase